MSTLRCGKEFDAAGVNWTEMAEKLPTSRSAKDRQYRRKKFNQMDINGNNYLSLAEVDKGVRDVLKCDHLFHCKPVLMRAFQAVKDTAKAHTPHSDDYVTRSEFRLLLVALRQMFELWQMFEMIDTTDDRRVELDEFKKAVPLMAKWGVKIEDPEKTFAEIDTNGGGKILFVEFEAWASKMGLDLEDDDD